MRKEYSWYNIVEDTELLQQGDFINECPIVILPSEIPLSEEFLSKLEITMLLF